MRPIVFGDFFRELYLITHCSLILPFWIASKQKFLQNQKSTNFLFFGQLSLWKSTYTGDLQRKACNLWIREKCPNLRFFWPVFSHIQTKYGDLLCKSPYWVRIWENTDHRKLWIGTYFMHFLKSVFFGREYRPKNDLKFAYFFLCRAVSKYHRSLQWGTFFKIDGRLQQRLSLSICQECFELLDCVACRQMQPLTKLIGTKAHNQNFPNNLNKQRCMISECDIQQNDSEWSYLYKKTYSSLR